MARSRAGVRPEAGAVGASLDRRRHFDVLIVGAGLSGIGGACDLQRNCPSKSFAILEGRDAIGGTWDLFRYPGIRSDSDMHTMGYSFRPWAGEKAIADGPDILQYIRDTARACGVERHIKFGERAMRAAWNSAEALWTVDVESGPERRPVQYACNFLYMCSGYYDYSEGYMPGWPGMERFAGRIAHPQQWPGDLDYAGRRVVVIGSGATAVTLVPAMAERAAHVIMLQRSPSYIAARPAKDAVANWMNRRLPANVAHGLVRWKNVLYGMYIYRMAKRKPEFLKNALITLVRQQLGPDYDVDKHFTPDYNPWDQRLCLVPDADLFAAIRSGKASVVTDRIEAFTETGLALRSGATLDADIIVTATGLKVQMMGGMEIVVDGKPVNLAKTMAYKGMMYSDIPNLASAFGYANASWTLKCELTSAYVCRLLNFMDARGFAWCVPRRRDASIAEETSLPLTSGYIQRAQCILPKQGSKRPWKLYQNYFLDLTLMRLGSVEDGTMEFGPPRCWTPRRGMIGR
jgi:monooxygenase